MRLYCLWPWFYCSTVLLVCQDAISNLTIWIKVVEFCPWANSDKKGLFCYIGCEILEHLFCFTGIKKEQMFSPAHLLNRAHEGVIRYGSKNICSNRSRVSVSARAKSGLSDILDFRALKFRSLATNGTTLPPFGVNFQRPSFITSGFENFKRQSLEF